MSLPQELVDVIVDFLQDDRWSLHSCSVVCKSMVQRCTKYLFHRISVTTSRFSDCIRCLRSSNRLSHAIVDFVIIGDMSTYIMPVHVHTVTMLLPRLESLRFSGLFQSFAPRPALPLAIRKRQLATLRFDFIHLDLIECVLEMLDTVGEVVLEGPYVEGSVNAPRNAGRVRALRVRTRPQWLASMCQLFQPSSLTSADIAVDAPSLNAYDLERFLQTYGWNLRRLSLQLPPRSLAPTLPVHALDSCTKLVAFTLTLPRRDTWSMAHHLIRASPSSLRELRLIVRSDGTWGDEDWRRLAVDLEDHAQLERFDIEYTVADSSTPVSHEMQQHIRTVLSPQLSTILHFPTRHKL